MICTDVAARGIDVRGVPYGEELLPRSHRSDDAPRPCRETLFILSFFLISVVNVTLPDEKQNYVHRIGRVGRAER